ncbi:hypothetical protein [Humisphaera borealis]|uniref:Uncharacterized protein n=1 Tax=Humisphaera borealis TaxID=2807512 RepID=A0A7M2WWM4_9BACT|nr:hypothetical protein [Humisphaera borealis]QOV89895.1 hypothetical protein IPV69_00535 [Humisphaera borealis]
MSQVQNNVTRFAGPSMIQDSHHMSGIPQVQDDKRQVARQSEQGQSTRSKKGSKQNQGGDFDYQNPRQYY